MIKLFIENNLIIIIKMDKKRICAHASKAKGKAKRKTKKYVGVFELDPATVNIGKIIGNVSGTQYIVEDILDRSVCHTTARSNIRAFRLPSATLVAYATMRSTFDQKTNKVRNMGELIKVINEDEYDDITEHFPKITKDMIYLSLEKLNMSSNIATHKSLYDVENIHDDISDEEIVHNRLELDDMPSYSDYEDDSDLADDEADDEVIDTKSVPELEELDAADTVSTISIKDEIELNRKRRKDLKHLKKSRTNARFIKSNKENDYTIPINEINEIEEDINIDDI